MKTDQTMWELFLQTGRVDDYLQYRRSCQPGAPTAISSAYGGADTAHAAENQWNRPAGLPDTRG